MMLGKSGFLLLFQAVIQVSARYKNVIPNPIENAIDTGDSESSRIAGGWEAQLGQFPHHASLRMFRANGTFGTCGGAVVAREWILTAAQCTAGRATIVVRVGVLLRADNNPENMFETTEWYNFPTFDDSRPAPVQPNDIALVRLQRRLVYSDLVQPIRVQSGPDSYRDYDGELMYVTGHGRVSSQVPVSDVLRWVYLRAMSNMRCIFSFPSGYVDNTIICARYDSNSAQTPCRADYGGPLVHVGDDGIPTVVGIYVFATNEDGNCLRGLPTGYTRPGPYLSWFREITGLDFGNLKEDDEEDTTTEPAITPTEPAPTTESATTPTEPAPTNEPTTTPTEPAPTTEPATTPTEPAPITEPATTPTEPAPTTEPATTPTEPAPTTESATTPTEPAPTTESANTPTEPAPTTEPATTPSEPAPTTEPATTPTEPAPTTEPANTPTEPATTPTEPAPTTEPANTPTEPATTPTEPAPTTEPATTPTEPPPTTEPATTPNEPAPTPTEPAATTTKPAPTIEPVPTTSEPTQTTEPVPTPTEPATIPTEPATTPTEPASTPTEPAPTTTESAPTTTNPTTITFPTPTTTESGPDDSTPEDTTTSKPEDSGENEDDKDEEDSDSSDCNDEMGQLMKRLLVNVKVKVAMNKYKVKKETGLEVNHHRH